GIGSNAHYTGAPVVSGEQGPCELPRFGKTLDVGVGLYRNPTEGPAELVVNEPETNRTPLLSGFERTLARLLAVVDQIRSGSGGRPAPRAGQGAPAELVAEGAVEA